MDSGTPIRRTRPPALARRALPGPVTGSRPAAPRLSVLDNVLTGSLARLPLWRALSGAFGYLLLVLWLMLQTVEIAAWGTLLAIAVGAPLALLGARGYSPHPLVMLAAHGFASFLRSIPDLISALFFVLAFGFGPIAGILALGLHTAGFLGKFFAEDIENAPRGPQDALRAAGAGRLKVLRFAVLPQVMPSYMGYMQYILERNIRTATVIGIVGAGGIGQELKGCFEMFQFQHVATMLLVIFFACWRSSWPPVARAGGCSSTVR